ncbi:MAG: histidine phosphatase family protein [Candidatus Microgenomates bacterium]|jgi:broad specificity phosphatase PhoE
MTDFYIFRHGDTVETDNLLIKIFGRKRDSHGLSILPKGLPALKRIGKYLKNIPIDANFCSPYLRCIESIKIVGNSANKKYQFDERIRELENGNEKLIDFHKRIDNFLDEIYTKKYSAVLICTHGAVIAAIKYLITRGNFSFLQLIDFPKPGNLIIIKNKKVYTINFNQKD